MSLRFCVLLSIIASSLVIHVVPFAQAQRPFALSVSPDRVFLGTVNASVSWLNVTIMAGEGFNGTVSFSVFGTPPGVTATFQDPVVHLAPLAMFATCLEVAAHPDAGHGNYSLTVAAASQGPSVFYAAASQVALVIQETGHASTSPRCNRTQTGNPLLAEPGYLIPSYVSVFVAGIVLGSAIMYVAVYRSRRPRGVP